MKGSTAGKKRQRYGFPNPLGSRGGYGIFAINGTSPLRQGIYGNAYGKKGSKGMTSTHTSHLTTHKGMRIYRHALQADTTTWISPAKATVSTSPPVKRVDSHQGAALFRLYRHLEGTSTGQAKGMVKWRRRPAALLPATGWPFLSSCSIQTKRGLAYAHQPPPESVSHSNPIPWPSWTPIPCREVFWNNG